MISLASGLRVYLACGVTDMRKGMVGLSMLVQQNLAEDPFGHGRNGVVVPGVGQSDLPARPDGIDHRGVSERRAEQRRYQDNLHVLSLAAPADNKLSTQAFWLTVIISTIRTDRPR